ncbi:MAG: diguanylate cyclase [Burkholderiales bacterium]|nr:diguanylate cyclase [Burkholderiales bacterium]
MDVLRARNLLLWGAMLAAALVGVALPSLYFYQGLSNEQSASAAAVRMQSATVMQVISRNPENWRFQDSLLREVLATGTGDPDERPREVASRVLRLDGSIVLETAELPAGPRVVRRATLSESGQAVGYLEHAVGLRPLLKSTVLVTLAGTLLAMLVYWFLRLLLLRTVHSGLAALQAEVRRAEAALAEKAAVEGELRRQARQERLLEALAAASNTARTPGEAMSQCLGQICEFTGWQFGHAALVDFDGDKALTRVDFWHRPAGEAYDRFAEANSRHRHDVAGGKFVGKVLRTGVPVWITELSGSQGATRAAQFASIGVHTGMAFPILRGREPIGFFEFFSEAALEPDAELTALVQRASGYVGGVAERVEAADQISRLNQDLERRVAERTAASERASALLAARGREAAAIGEMTGVLQVAENLEEAGRLVARYLPVILHGTAAGALYLLRASRDSLERLSTWGDTVFTASFPPAQCWGMRRGQPHGSLDGAVPLRCAHVADGEAPGGTLCLPLVAQGESLGLLEVVYAEAGDADSRSDRLAAAKRITEQLSLALANVRLRESLREQSIRDALTGLHNRRYLEESLDRELARSARDGQPLAVFMLDVDHFKRYNDTHGHDAGDAVLRELGRELRKCARASDIVCRFGGEEFVVVLADASGDAASAWSERFMQNVRAMEVRLGNRALPSITVSMGLAVFPQHADGADALLRAADEALYEAKRDGRDRLRVVRLQTVESRQPTAVAA